MVSELLLDFFKEDTILIRSLVLSYITGEIRSNSLHRICPVEVESVASSTEEAV